MYSGFKQMYYQNNSTSIGSESSADSTTVWELDEGVLLVGGV